MAASRHTHDRRGRRLSPALSELLQSTVIPVPTKGKWKSTTTAATINNNNNNDHFNNDHGKSHVTPSRKLADDSRLFAPLVEDDVVDFSPTTFVSTDFDDSTDYTDVDSVFAADDTTSNISNSRRTSIGPRDPNSFWNWSFMDSPLPYQIPRPITRGSASTYRSPMSESGDDDESVLSAYGSFFTPPSCCEDFDSESRDSSSVRLTRRKISIPVIEPALQNHPLSDSSETDADETFSSANSPAELNQPTDSNTNEPKKSFVSNLTASLKALSGVAQSFTSSQENLYTSRMLVFSPRATDESIPNYRATTVKKQQQQTRKDATAGGPTAKTIGPMSISMTTYNVQSNLIPQLRPRELRMNSEFYRVYAVESLMRAHGKLDEDFQGRAQMILPPRQDHNEYVLDEDDKIETVFGIRKRFVSSFDSPKNSSSTIPPRRWSSITADSLASVST